MSPATKLRRSPRRGDKARRIASSARFNSKKIVDDHLGWIVTIATKVMRDVPYHSGVTLSDAINIGKMALFSVLPAWNPEVGALTSFAFLRVRGSMIDALRGEDPLTKDQRVLVKTLEAARDAFVEEHRRVPDTGELSDCLGVTPERIDYIRLLAKYAKLLSFESLEHPEKGGPLEAERNAFQEDDPPSPLDLAIKNDLLRVMDEASKKLTPRQQLVLDLYYKKELTQKEIAEILGVDNSRICQILREALGQLKEEVHTQLKYGATISRRMSSSDIMQEFGLSQTDFEAVERDVPMLRISPDKYLVTIHTEFLILCCKRTC